MFVIFLALIIGPVVARTFFDLPMDGTIPMELMQPTGLDNNDTIPSETGTAVSGGATESADSKVKLF